MRPRRLAVHEAAAPAAHEQQLASLRQTAAKFEIEGAALKQKVAIDERARASLEQRLVTAERKGAELDAARRAHRARSPAWPSAGRSRAVGSNAS